MPLGESHFDEPFVSETPSTTIREEGLPYVVASALKINYNPIGSGIFGRVYKGTYNHENIGNVAIKIADEDPKKISSLRKESAMLYKYGNQHPHIVKWYGMYKTPKSIGFVMEYMDCGSMDKLLLDNKLRHLEYSIDHVLSWLRQTTEAIKYMHSLNLVHRDLKPHNLLLRDNYLTLKICDFGTVVDLHTTMTNCVGSALYMSPEVFRGMKYDNKCDVYSIGIILWQMITRRSPYASAQGASHIAILWNVAMGERPRDVNCHPLLMQTMNRCWATDPADRPTIDKVHSMAEILCKVYPNGNKPLKSTNSTAPQPITSQRLSTGRVGHRRTRSDELTIFDGGRNNSGRVSSTDTSHSRTRSRDTTPLHSGHALSSSSVSHTDLLSQTELMLSQIPAELRPPAHIRNDDSSEQSYNEHLGMCMEYIDMQKMIKAALARKHASIQRVRGLLKLQKLIKRKESLQNIRDEAYRKIKSQTSNSSL